MTASAANISVGTWYQFSFTTTGSALTGGVLLGALTNPDATPAPQTPWTFTLTKPGTLFVTDTQDSIDRFELFNGLTPLGETSVNTPGSGCGFDLSCAINNADYSKATFALLPGSYSITGIVTLSPSGAGDGAFLLSEVPIPAALPLFASGLAALGLAGRRKRAAVA
jgi:hypothetical protein